MDANSPEIEFETTTSLSADEQANTSPAVNVHPCSTVQKYLFQKVGKVKIETGKHDNNCDA